MSDSTFPHDNAYVELSEANRKFYDLAMERPEGRLRSTFESVHTSDGLVTKAMQSWPTFMSIPRAEAMGEVAVKVSRLMTSVPRKFFDGDRQRLVEFYGEPSEDPELTFAMVEDRAVLDRMVGRGDFLDTHRGLMCVEFNLTAALGGWEIVLLVERYRRNPFIARFLQDQGIEFTVRDTLDIFLDHAFDHLLKDGLVQPNGALNTAILLDYFAEDRAGVEKIRAFLGHRYALFLQSRKEGLSGAIDVCRFAELGVGESGVHLGDLPIHLAMRRSPGELPQEVIQAVLDHRLHYYQPAGLMLGDKRNLALLSAALESGETLDEEELRLVERHIPWTRLARPGAVRYDGSETQLEDLLAAEKDRLVLKSGQGGGGHDVVIGAEVSTEAWDEAVSGALEAGAWVVQEMVGGRPFSYQVGDEGVAPCNVVWGLFTVGGRYGGGFLRMSPQSGSAVLNLAYGAEVGYIFEVDEGQE